MVKVIYFDYHGVLDRHTFQGLLETMGQTYVARQPNHDVKYVEEFVRKEQDIGWGYVSGEVLPHFYWDRIAKEYGPDVDRAGRAYQLHVQPIREMWNLLSDLHDDFNLGLFSDCSLDNKEVIRSAYALTDYFDYLIFSCDVRMTKRDPNFHRLMLQNGLYQPAECLLIDDGIDNLTMAATLGFQTHVFRDVVETKQYLSTVNTKLNDYTG